MGDRRWTGWRPAWERAHLGPGGFYREHGPPFRTAASHLRALAPAVLRLLAEVDTRLGRPGRLDLVDVGAGDGALVAAVLARAARQHGDLADRLRVTAVDVRPRPAGLDPRVGWRCGRAPDVLAVDGGGRFTGLVMAWEWLDDVACDVVQRHGGDWRAVLVDVRTGDERLGPPLHDAAGCAALGIDAAPAQAWLDAWWPAVDDGTRVEVGVARDAAWAGLLGSLRVGTALAVDYDQRPAARSVSTGGTLAGYAAGRRVAPVPDGSANVTAHVALDSCAAAGLRTGRVRRSVLTDQATALHRLGVDPTPPPAADASADPRGYLAALARAGDAAVLTDPRGLGGFGWLEQDVTPG